MERYFLPPIKRGVHCLRRGCLRGGGEDTDHSGGVLKLSVPQKAVAPETRSSDGETQTRKLRACFCFLIKKNDSLA